MKICSFLVVIAEYLENQSENIEQLKRLAPNEWYESY